MWKQREKFTTFDLGLEVISSVSIQLYETRQMERNYFHLHSDRWLVGTLR
jgi:hypothetical protein